MFADKRRFAKGTQSSLGWNGCDYRVCNVGSRKQFHEAKYVRGIGRNAEAKRLFNFSARQIPRSALLGKKRSGAIRSRPNWWRRLPVLLRLRRRRNSSVL